MTSPRPISVLVNAGFDCDLCLYICITFESERQTQKEMFCVKQTVFQTGIQLDVVVSVI